jgi:excisionase family DNA binding protein
MRHFRVRYIPIFTGKEPVIPDRRILEAKELLRPDEVAHILRVSRSTVYFMISTGELETVKVNGCYRIKTACVRRIIEGDRG